MGESALKRQINKKLKDKWGYSKQQIKTYWEVKGDLTEDELNLELKNI